MCVHFTCTASVFLRIVTRLLFRRWYIRCVILLSQCIWCPTFSCAATTRWPSQVMALDWFQVTVLLLVFFFLLLINSWCAVSNYHSRKLNFMLLSAQLSFIYVWWMEVLQAVACIRVFKKEKRKSLSSIVPSCFHPTAQIDSNLTEKSFWMSAAGWCWQMDTVILFGCLGACRSTLC